MVEKVSNRARKRGAKSSNSDIIEKLRKREKVDKSDELKNISQAEKIPKLKDTIEKKSDTKKPESKKIAQRVKSAPSTAKRFIANHKKGSVGILITILIASALFIGSIIVSGPMQFMQFVGLVKGQIQFMSDGVSSTRIMRNVVDIAQGSTVDTSSVGNNRFEKMARLVTNSYTSQLADRGVELNNDSSQIVIDLEARYTQADFDEVKMKQRVSDELKVDINKLNYNDKTISFKIDSGWSDDQNNDFLLALEKEIGNPSLNKVSSLRRNRMTMRLNLYSWLHPISHADQVELRQTMGYLEAWYASRLLRMTGRETNGEIAEELASELKSVLDGKMVKRATNVDTSDMDDDPASSWMTLALAMACVNERVTATEVSLYTRVVIPAIMEALAVRSIEGEIRAIALNNLSTGLQDFTFDDLSGPTQDFFFDNIQTSSGSSAAISGWSSAPVKAALGYRINDVDIANTVDYALRFYELRDDVTGEHNPATIVNNLVATCRDFFANGLTGEAVKNFIASSLSEEANNILGWIKSKFGFEQVYWADKVAGVGSYSLQTFGMDPSQKLSTAMYGSKFLEDFDNTTLGGRELSDEEVAVLYRDDQARLAGEYQDKSVMDKLFDTSDHRSAISKLAREDNWDTSGNSLSSHFVNIAKSFAKAPQTLLSNIASIFSKEANASTVGPYNYGVPWYGYSKAEQSRLRNISNTQNSVFKNAEALYAIIGQSGGATRLNDTAKNCFSTSVAKDASLAKVNNVYSVDYMLQDGNINPNYAAGMLFNYEDCHTFDLSYENLMTLRTYILDYNLLSSAACFEASAYPDREFDSDGDGVDDMTYIELGVHACSDFTADNFL